MASEFIAYCGLYCGACSFRVAFEDNDRNHIEHMPMYYNYLKNKPLEFCPGCRLENKCGECTIRDCAIEKKVEYCSQCNDFPCDKLKKFSNDGKPHHGEAISNLNMLKEIGEKKWLDLMKEKWTCSKCGSKYSWYYKKCTKCDADDDGLY
ncbi:DUF3795 domain-containing protein [Clostridium scatologenes]|uniref:DUF3795 domain-containing protein n=1 Tax=Clostridium scatologenes TaxID=1548 RepID=A0A0E3K212_CLOSL|nr:DUF3795 domain-containing protein [Clostridium scatologenes]AKA70399.1 hypothetical protein CSCA_3274 [Clostridium scatologenes]